MTMKYKHHLLELCAIAAPMIVGNLGHVLTGAIDVLIAARHSVNTLASVAIANSVLFTVFIVGIGFLTGISIILSNFRGERKRTKEYLLSGIYLSLILAFLTWIAIIALTLIIPKCGFETNLIKDIQDYMFISSFSIFGMFLYQAVKEFLQAHEIVNFPNFILLVTVVLNLILNIIFVFGYGPIPEMGAAGLALATLIVRTILGLSMILYTKKILITQTQHKKYNLEYIKKVIKIGFPIGIGLMFEFLGFNIITMSVGRDSGLLAATHNILLTLIDATFMIPLAISSAIAIKAGFFNGAKNYEEVKNYGITGVSICTLFMMFCSLMFLIKPEFFIGIFTKDSQIVTTAIPIVTLFALFEIGDGLQISLGGILKGLKLTKQVTVCVLSSYWAVGIPLGFYMAYGLKMSLKGFWLGLTISLFLISLLEFLVILKTAKNIKKEI